MGFGFLQCFQLDIELNTHTQTHTCCGVSLSNSSGHPGTLFAPLGCPQSHRDLSPSAF